MLRQCDNCSKYNVPEYESSCTTVAPKIKCSIRWLVGEEKLICNLCEMKNQMVRYEVERY